MCEDEIRIVRASVLRGMTIKLLVQDPSTENKELVLLHVDAPTLATMTALEGGLWQQVFTNKDGSKFKLLVELADDGKSSIFKRNKK